MAIERGTIKWFDEEKGFGFITSDINDKDIFFYRNDLDTLEQTIEKGTVVEFEPGLGSKGKEARHVRPLE